MKAKLTIINDPVWGARFRCPIDRKTTYIKTGEVNVHFGATSAFMREDSSLRKAAVVDWDNRTVTEV